MFFRIEIVLFCAPHKTVAPDEFPDEVQVGLEEVDNSDLVGGWVVRLFLKANRCGL